MASVTTRKPRGANHTVTIATAEDMFLDGEGGKWVVICDEHGSIANTTTQAEAFGYHPADFCESCADELLN